MRATCYLRVAKTSRGFRFSAASKSTATPLADGAGYPITTKLIKVNLELPADMFGPDAEAIVDVMPHHVRDIEAASE